jgi:hypothetical protein
MKNKFLLLVFTFIFGYYSNAQKVIFHKTIDSVEVNVIKNDNQTVYVLANCKGKIDTLWNNQNGMVHVHRVVDIKLFQNKFAMIYFG